MSTDYCSIMHGESVHFPSSGFRWSLPSVVLSFIRGRTWRPALALFSPSELFPKAVTVRILTTVCVCVCVYVAQPCKAKCFFFALSMTERWILFFSGPSGFTGTSADIKHLWRLSWLFMDSSEILLTILLIFTKTSLTHKMCIIFFLQMHALIKSSVLCLGWQHKKHNFLLVFCHPFCEDAKSVKSWRGSHLLQYSSSHCYLCGGFCYFFICFF